MRSVRHRSAKTKTKLKRRTVSPKLAQPKKQRGRPAGISYNPTSLVKNFHWPVFASFGHRKRGRPRKNRLTLPHFVPYRQIGTLLIIIGIIIAIFPFAYLAGDQFLTSHPNSLSIMHQVTSKDVVTTDPGPIHIDPALMSLKEPAEPPERIIVPSQKIDLSVIEAPVINGYWELSDTTASHGVGSANPGENGNVVIFAHAFEGLFLPLRNVQIGDEVTVLTHDHWYRYHVTQTQLVDPSQVEVVAPTPDQTLTLYTCDGFMDSKRLIVTAKPIS